MPLVENLFLEQNFGGEWNRYFFTFVFRKEFFEHTSILDLEIDLRFVKKLLRNVISLKMNQIGIHTRQFYSSDYKKVFVVLKCQENALKLQAAVNYFLD